MTYSINDWKHTTKKLRALTYDARKRRDKWRKKYYILKQRFEYMQYENEELKKELAKYKKELEKHLIVESKINGWKVFEERYNNANTR